MTVIGVTGPSGSGKSLFGSFLRQHGHTVIDADGVYHSLLLPPSPCLDALRDAFGDRVFQADGSLDRSALSEIVFHDEEKLALLNKTVLGFVLTKIREMIRERERLGEDFVIVDAPTLIESGFHRECDRVVSILSPTAQRLRRIMERDGISEERALSRIQAQKDEDFYRAHSDLLLVNEGTEAEFFEKAKALATELSLPLLPTDKEEIS